MLKEENEDQIANFLSENEAFTCLLQRRFSPLQGGDGFFLALLKRQS
jgi:16S rRNA (cytosine967-C5)-methyltransferase